MKFLLQLAVAYAAAVILCCDWLLLLQLLAWLCTDKGSGEAQRHSIAAALAVLASAPGSRGLSLASAWLGDMLVTLSHNVKTYSSIRVVGPSLLLFNLCHASCD